MLRITDLRPGSPNGIDLVLNAEVFVFAGQEVEVIRKREVSPPVPRRGGKSRATSGRCRLRLTKGQSGA